MSSSPTAALQDAIALHRRGDLDGAVARYDAILRADPRNADALHHLAMARCQRGQFARGIAAARGALALAPDNAATHDLLGMAFARTGTPGTRSRASIAPSRSGPTSRKRTAIAPARSPDLGARNEALNRLRARARPRSVLGRRLDQPGRAAARAGPARQGDRELRSRAGVAAEHPRRARQSWACSTRQREAGRGPGRFRRGARDQPEGTPRHGVIAASRCRNSIALPTRS